MLVSVNGQLGDCTSTAGPNCYAAVQEFGGTNITTLTGSPRKSNLASTCDTTEVSQKRFTRLTRSMHKGYKHRDGL